ncbi:hypothetical protein EDB86DRAFT_483162 [Lactarius hatsudake]|nr:hypothetical protein EDB86DRAFT_483162 [Lactarius hatsudake]
MRYCCQRSVRTPAQITCESPYQHYELNYWTAQVVCPAQPCAKTGGPRASQPKKKKRALSVLPNTNLKVGQSTPVSVRCSSRGHAYDAIIESNIHAESAVLTDPTSCIAPPFLGRLDALLPRFHAHNLLRPSLPKPCTEFAQSSVCVVPAAAADIQRRLAAVLLGVQHASLEDFPGCLARVYSSFLAVLRPLQMRRLLRFLCARVFFSWTGAYQYQFSCSRRSCAIPGSYRWWSMDTSPRRRGRYQMEARHAVMEIIVVRPAALPGCSSGFLSQSPPGYCSRLRVPPLRRLVKPRRLGLFARVGSSSWTRSPRAVWGRGSPARRICSSGGGIVCVCVAFCADAQNAAGPLAKRAPTFADARGLCGGSGDARVAPARLIIALRPR